MNTKIKFFGKTASASILVAALAMAASGAAVGSVLAGDLAGQLPVTVSQGLLVDYVSFPDGDANWSDSQGTVRGVSSRQLVLRHGKPDRSIGVVNDDRTQFQAAAEIYVGDKYLVQVCFANASSQEVVAQLDITTQGLKTEVFGSDEETASPNDRVTEVTRVGASAWQFKIAGGANGTGVVTNLGSENAENAWQDCIGIQVASSVANPPGDYKMTAQVKQVGS